MYVIGDSHVVCDTNDTRKSTTTTDHGTARNRHTSRDRRVFANYHVMCDVNQIIDYNPISNLGITQGSPVYGCAGTDLDIVSNN